MKQVQKDLMMVIKCVLHHDGLPERINSMSSGEKSELLNYARKQNLLPFFQYFDSFFEGGQAETFRNSIFSCVYMDAVLSEEVHGLLDQFEADGIGCVPLKGIQTKALYPSTELRTMGDLDILYQGRQSKKLRETMEKLGYEWHGEAAKHDHYQKGPIIVEMHKDLLPAESHAYGYFKDIWERTKKADGKTYVRQMKPEDHYMYTVCHLIEHFIRGGIGIRMVLDIYVLFYLHDLDQGYIRDAAEQMGIADFEDSIRMLALSWFGTKEQIEKELRPGLQLGELEEYIVSGGVFGSEENAVQNGALHTSGSIRYMTRTVFLPYASMKTVFPWLKTPFLLPAAWILRIWNVVTKRKENIRLLFHNAEAYRHIEASEKDKRRRFFERWGLGNTL